MTRLKNKNAVKHGVYSNTEVLPWESQGEFDDLVEELRRTYPPVGPLEEANIRDLARLKHLKRRVGAAYHLAVTLNSFAQKAVAAMEQGQDTLTLLISEEAQRASRPLSSVEQVRLIKEQIRQSKEPRTEEPDPPEKKVDTTTTITQVHGFFSRLHGLPEMDEMLKREATIDAQIDKAMGRLALLRELRRQYGAAPAVEGPKSN